MLLGLSPKDIFDEAVANMICDEVEDLRNGCVKIYYEQDETKKVNSKCFGKRTTLFSFKDFFWQYVLSVVIVCFQFHVFYSCYISYSR